MNGIAEAAVELQTRLEFERRAFCVIGGPAVICWREYRGTQDVHVSVMVEFGDERNFAELLLSQFQNRMPDTAEGVERSSIWTSRLPDFSLKLT